MAYTRKREKAKNVLMGVMIGGIVVGLIAINIKAEEGIVRSDQESVATLSNKIEDNAQKSKEEPKEEHTKENKINNTIQETISDEMRIQDYTNIKIPGNIKVGDWVDIRIKNQKAEDRVVLSKKKIVRLEGNTIWFQIDYQERQNMNHALIDQIQNKEVLYVTKYINPDKQKPAIINYVKQKG